MDVQEILKALPEDQRDVVITAIEAEKQRGIDESKRKGAENAKLRRDLDAHRSAIKNVFEIDVSDPAELPDALSKYKTSTVNKSEYVPVKDFEVLKKQVAEERGQREAAEKNLRNSRAAEKLNHAFGDSIFAKAITVKDLVESGKVRLTSSDEIVFVDGDEEISAAKGVELYKKNNPDQVKNNSKPGGGSTAGTKDKKGEKIISESEWEAMSGRERAAKMAEGYKIQT